jgi:hypothetical protein
MSMIPPYPLALPLAAWPATTLLNEVASARRLGRPFLFSQDNSPQERAAESRSISTMMLAVDEDLELRSVSHTRTFSSSHSTGTRRCSIVTCLGE